MATGIESFAAHQMSNIMRATVAVLCVLAGGFAASANDKPKCSLKACELRGIHIGMDVEAARAIVGGKDQLASCRLVQTNRRQPAMHTCALATIAGTGLSVRHHEGKVTAVMVKDVGSASDAEMKRHISQKFGEATRQPFELMWGAVASRDREPIPSHPDGIVLIYSAGVITLQGVHAERAAIDALKAADPNRPVPPPPVALPKL
jgi:hypothetical protein